MKKQTAKKLTLKSETLRTLASKDLGAVRGGGFWVRIMDAVTILCNGDSGDCGKDSGGIRG